MEKPIETGPDVKHRILAFGDSLTEGFCEHGFHFHPYSIKLEELLLQNGYSAKVYQRGVSGECVVSGRCGYSRAEPGMDQRLPALLRQAEEQGVQFDWVVILGGINDIGWGTGPQDIYEGLQGLYRACRDHGARVLALTCMETLHSRGGMRDGRAQLNDMIRGTPQQLDHVDVADLAQAILLPSGPKDVERHSLWDDGLHLTPKGYDLMGEFVFSALKDKLQNE